ncbi:methyltransferase [Panacibacter sp. DH6]|uniref:tRNA1(Val) (adenine(37)-N6)-methyltransferase n=1 Tax=Panacibacter microcysteis TaxID=2793269 RepID=A0A931E7E9_9BACT|nr:methyltransferase [Panacibacter microcysteis]MBG9376655.1 methyltransferase [Panacibacter microcysteis]
MPNNFFRFKEFTVHQELCAMKVCTDACLFGAWLAGKLKDKALKQILDIGTGTGLLSLMLAQKTNAFFDAVEIDTNAAVQAQQNFRASPWADRLRLCNVAIQAFKPAHQYDCIISNPPFFENDLKSLDCKRNLALHSAALSLEELLQFAADHLAADGLFAVLLPFHRSAYFEQMAQRRLYLQQKVLVKQTMEHPYFRSMLLFATSQKTCTQEDTITIRDNKREYSETFASLLKDYYLYL